MRNFLLPAAILAVATQAAAAPLAMPHEAGQSAFGAIHEMIEVLKADPATDWSKVNIDALRDHLVDMDRVMLGAHVVYEAVPNGERMTVTGDDATRDAIRRMLGMHIAMAGTTADWTMRGEDVPGGMRIVVRANNSEAMTKLKALGFFGLIAEGDHHPRHHRMMASGAM